MGKNLAIRGHSTRGKEVIELLEMIGGNNVYKFSGDNSYAYYVIEGCQNEIRVGEHIFGDEDMHFFTIEEFLEKYPFKVGDVVVYTKFGNNCDDYPVVIETMKWTGTTIEYAFNDCVTCLTKDLKMWNSNDNPTNVSKMKNVLAELLEHIKTTPKEELEREFEEINEWSDVGPTVEEFMDFCKKVNKKPVYPKTYKECCNIICPDTFTNDFRDCRHNKIEGHKCNILTKLQRLLVCRDAYWKIAGKEMGLDKPWEPDWRNSEQNKYVISYDYGRELNTHKIKCSHVTHILAFPTEEMRDAFHENFGELIESCKELL